MEVIKTTVRQFIIENFLFEEDENLKDDTSFLESGIIDSTGVLEMVTFLEDTYEIHVEDEDMIPENLDSLEAIATYITRKRNSS
jgi:acyl carrier protein